MEIKFSLEQLFELYHECEFFEKTGTLPNDAKLRTLIKASSQSNQQDTALAIQLYSGLIYRALAKKLMEAIKLLK